MNRINWIRIEPEWLARIELELCLNGSEGLNSSSSNLPTSKIIRKLECFGGKILFRGTFFSEISFSENVNNCAVFSSLLPKLSNIRPSTMKMKQGFPIFEFIEDFQFQIDRYSSLYIIILNFNNLPTLNFCTFYPTPNAKPPTVSYHN